MPGLLIETKKYLGDGIYGYFDGFNIVLKAEGGTLSLHPDVLEMLDLYRKQIRSQYNAPVIGNDR